MKIQLIRSVGFSKSSAQRKIYKIGGTYQKRRKIKTNNLSFYLLKLEKKEQIKFKVNKKLLEHKSMKLKTKNSIEKNQ